MPFSEVGKPLNGVAALVAGCAIVNTPLLIGALLLEGAGRQALGAVGGGLMLVAGAIVLAVQVVAPGRSPATPTGS